LARFFIQHYNAKFKQQIEGLSPETESALLNYNWPCNVRELRNAIERAMILEDTAYLRPANLHIASCVGESELVSAAAAVSGSVPDSLSLLEHERLMLVQALDTTCGNQTQAARLLRIARDTLRYKMKKLNLS
jgi:DNA-binding NtrC family response regulator